MAKAKSKKAAAEAELPLSEEAMEVSEESETSESEEVENEFAGGVSVKLRRHAGEGLYRAGLHFAKGQLKSFKAGELSDEQLERLKAEPKLEVFDL